MKAEWIGLKEANAALRRLPEYARVGVQQEEDTTAFQVARGMQSRVRRRTGFLLAHITWQSRPRSVSAVVGTDDPAAFYWKFLEYGTVNMPAKPFARAAADALRADHDQRLLRALEQAAAQVERTGAV